MSVYSMAKQAQDGAEPPKDWVSAVTTYIPSEALAIYVALLGILVPSDTKQMQNVWLLCVAVGIVTTLVVAWTSFDASTSPVSQPEAARRRIFVAVLGSGAFIGYALATQSFLGGNPPLTIAWTAWGTAIAALITLLGPVIAKAFRIRDLKPA